MGLWYGERSVVGVTLNKKADNPNWIIRFSYDLDGNRTRVTAVKGRCLSRLTTRPNLKSIKIL